MYRHRLKLGILIFCSVLCGAAPAMATDYMPFNPDLTSNPDDITTLKCSVFLIMIEGNSRMVLPVFAWVHGVSVGLSKSTNQKFDKTFVVGATALIAKGCSENRNFTVYDTILKAVNMK